MGVTDHNVLGSDTRARMSLAQHLPLQYFPPTFDSKDYRPGSGILRPLEHKLRHHRSGRVAGCLARSVSQLLRKYYVLLSIRRIGVQVAKVRENAAGQSQQKGQENFSCSDFDPAQRVKITTLFLIPRPGAMEF